MTNMGSAIDAVIVELQDPRVTAIPVQDNGEALIDIADIGTLKYGPPPESPETEAHYRLLREGVVSRLLDAQQTLPNGLKLRLYEGYRHPAFQAKLFGEQLTRTNARYPGLSKEDCFHETTKMVSPVHTYSGQPLIPPHSTGGTFDIEIVAADDQALDFGMTLTDWINVAPELCVSECPLVSDTARKNRQLLIRTLEQFGFVNYPREWWHFSFGDQYWAYMKNNAFALYGRIDD